MTRWIATLDEAGRDAPVALVASVQSAEARRSLLRRLAAAMLRMPPEAIAIVHEAGKPPRLLTPGGQMLRLSSASRDGWAALAVAGGPVGIDVERIVPGQALPWRVLHPDEASWLASLPPGERDRAFFRLWTLKEAYLKALGAGFAREPSGFRVRIADDAAAAIDDPLGPARVLSAETRWTGADLVASVVLVAPTL